MGQSLWTKERYAAFLEELFLQADEGYREFQKKILCTSLSVVGLRVPFLRKRAVQIAKAEGDAFLAVCGRDTQEERLLYGLVVAAMPVSYEEFLFYCDEYVRNWVENWALCDIFCTAVKKKLKGHEAEFFAHIAAYLADENVWVVRVGLVMMLSHYLEETYIKAVLERTDAIHSSAYYVRMAQAWLMATAWAKNREEMLDFLNRHHLDAWIVHKFVQKCKESKQITKMDKQYLVEWNRSLKKKLIL